MKNANMPAMPTTATLNRKKGEFQESQIDSDDFLLFGLTKREYFAGLAMQAWIQHHGTASGYSFTAYDCAHSAIECADVLLKQLDVKD